MTGMGRGSFSGDASALSADARARASGDAAPSDGSAVRSCGVDAALFSAAGFERHSGEALLRLVADLGRSFFEGRGGES